MAAFMIIKGGPVHPKIAAIRPALMVSALRWPGKSARPLRIPGAASIKPVLFFKPDIINLNLCIIFVVLKKSDTILSKAAVPNLFV